MSLVGKELNGALQYIHVHVHFSAPPQAPVAKRGRGRPKKTDSAAVPGKKRPLQDGADSADAAPPPAKRGRGRPKKADSAAAVPGTGTTGDESSGGGASAKRGRPKKNGVGDSTTDGGQPSTAAGRKKGWGLVRMKRN